MTKKIVSIMLIFAATSVAWMILGSSTGTRTYGQSEKLSEQVEGLWGSMQIQTAPTLYYETKRQKNVEKNETDEKGRQVKKVETITETVANKVNFESIKRYRRVP